MKTRKLILTIAAGMLLIASPSCQKAEFDPGKTEENNDVQTPSTGVTVFTASMEVPGAPDAAPAVAASAPDTRMTLVPVPDTENEVAPSWEVGDGIKIFYVDPATSQMTSVVATATAAGTSTDFTVDADLSGIETFYAVHPASLDASVDAGGNFSVPTKVDDSDEATFNNACISIAKCGSDKVFRFKNLCSVLKFEVENPGGILQISSMDGTPITGTVHASLGASGEVVYAAEPYTGTAYTRQFKKISGENQVCYVPVLPGVQAKGMAINYKATYASPAVFADFSIPFERSHIYSIGTLDSHLVTDYYITATGKGTRSGKSWENAGDVNTFKSLVGIVDGDPAKDNAVKCARYMQIWRTKGVTFHFGAGEYVFGNEDADRLTIDFYGANGSVYSEFTIQGGYPADGGNEVSSDNVTTFSGDDKYGILNVFDRARVHINDVTFANATSTASPASDMNIHTEWVGAALYMKQAATSGVDKAAPRVWLTRCVFDGNETNDTADNNVYGGGSAINLIHGAVYVDNCVFTNNHDNQGNGCIKLSGNKDYNMCQAYAFFNACVFTGNTVDLENVNRGAVILQNRQGALLGMYNCTLYNNTTDDGAGKISVHLDRSAIIANCTIAENTGGRYPIRFRAEGGNGDINYILANNIVLHTADAVKHSFALKRQNAATGFRLYNKGGNVFGTFNSTSYPNSDYITTVVDNEYTGYKYSDLDGATFTDNVFKWNGTLNKGATTCNYMSKETMINDVLKSSDINDADTNVTFSITGNNGESSFAGFYTWLNSIGAIDKDATGATRPDTGWTPGAYQAPAQAE